MQPPSDNTHMVHSAAKLPNQTLESAMCAAFPNNYTLAQAGATGRRRRIRLDYAPDQAKGTDAYAGRYLASTYVRVG